MSNSNDPLDNVVPEDDNYPLSIQNWRKTDREGNTAIMHEYSLYSDADFIGDGLRIGPYTIIHAINVDSLPPAIPQFGVRLFLRAQYAAGFGQAAFGLETRDETYHGGVDEDEIAALLSLCLGVRLKVGGQTRDFSDGFPLGRPMAERRAHGRSPIAAFDGRQVPHLLPWHSASARLAGAARMQGLVHLDPASAMALVRAARLYQEAVWMSDSAPELTWLLLVSALEVAADVWYQSDLDSKEDELKAFKSELHKELEGLEESQEAIRIVSDHLSGLIGSTKKFRKFCNAHFPDAPPEDRRPPAGFQVPWSKSKLIPIINKIYDYRSRALHGGTPFPFPMCEAPRCASNAYSEKPFGLATRAQGSQWHKDDTPIHLHMFEYFTRGALIVWWDSLQAQQQPAANGETE